MRDSIYVHGARENNLKNIDLELPRDKLVVLTGLSGSGKSSLAFDTIYAEGQRRYVESLSAYARQFLGQKEKPDVDSIDGLSPAISIDQKTTNNNPRSTVGTVTEIYDYLRLLYANIGVPHCPKCGKEIRQQTVDQMVDQVMALPEGTRIMVMAPVVRGRKGEHAKIFEDARKSGYVRVRVDGQMHDLEEEIKLDKNKKHRIDVIIDRLVVRDGLQQRLTDSMETASNLSGGIVTVNLPSEDRDVTYSQNYACDECGVFRLGQHQERLHRHDVLQRPLQAVSLPPGHPPPGPARRGHRRAPLRHQGRGPDPQLHHRPGPHHHDPPL